jgi:hypothetical protein
MSPGEFSLADVDKDFPIDLKNEQIPPWLQRMDRMMVLEAMVADGTLQRVGDRRGWYRPTQLDCPPMDLTDTDDMPVNMHLPFGLQKYCELYPGNIMTIGGEKNAGKSALLMNIAKENRDTQEVHYFSSEQGPAEMKVRLSLFSGMNMDEWSKVKFYERSAAFSDVIKPGVGKLNIIDFLECHEDFYAIGGKIRDIYDALHGAVAVIAIQQNPNTEDPIGGRRATEKSRIHLRMSPGRLDVKVAKNWVRSDYNPNGTFATFKLISGCEFRPDRNGMNIWRRELKE